jgi:D-beta-D-heptose 7-phosphate kinase / D-beta-D-heptose 1-phosphate adenosyltransferase
VTAGGPAVCVVGDALLDVDWHGAVDRVCRDAPVPVLEGSSETDRPGGAALAAVFVAASGTRTSLVTALGPDRNGRRLRTLLARARVEVVDLGLEGPTPVKLRLRAGGQSVARVDRWCTPIVTPGPWSTEATARVREADVVLVSDYGRGLATRAERAGLAELVGVSGAGGRPVLWDPHVAGPRPPHYSLLTTPNLAEAHVLSGRAGGAPARLPDIVALAAEVAGVLGSATVVTAGPLGAVLADGQAPPAIVPALPVQGDACGAGDCFAASAAAAVAAGRSPRQAVEDAVADAQAFVSGRVPTAARWHARSGAASGNSAVIALPTTGGETDAIRAAAAVRRAGGVVVAAGGCFDVLHAGHVRLLEQARRLGDHLVVCLNGDRSVSRLKGAHRPLNTAADRAAVLRGLGCVDGVVTFDGDTPCAALRAIRPDLFVKGSDYEGVELAEREVLAEWGGQVVLLPVVDGHSTTQLIATAVAAAG